MVEVSSLQTKIISKVFNRLGSTAVRKALDSSTTDKWGDATNTYLHLQDITAVPYNYFTGVLDYQPFGDLATGESIVAIRHDQDISIDDQIVWDSKTFRVMEVEAPPLQDEYVLKLVRIAEQY